MTRRASAGAINTAPRVVIDYAPDPRGASIFGALSGMLQRGVSGLDGIVYLGDHGSGDHAFHGYAQSPQKFRGEAALALSGAVRPTSPTTAMLDSARSENALADTPSRIFAARARRRSGGMP